MENPLLRNEDEESSVNLRTNTALKKTREEKSQLSTYLFEKYLSRLQYHYLSIENILEKDPLFYDIICQYISMLSYSMKIDQNIGYISIADGNLFYDIYFPVSYMNKKKNTRSKMGATSSLDQKKNEKLNDEETSKALYLNEAERTKELFRQIQYLENDVGIKVVIETYIAILSLIKYYHDIRNTSSKSTTSLDVNRINPFSSQVPFNRIHEDARYYMHLDQLVTDSHTAKKAIVTDVEVGEKSIDVKDIESVNPPEIANDDSYKEVKFKYCCCCRCGKSVITYPLEENLIKEIFILLYHMEQQLFELLQETEEDS